MELINEKEDITNVDAILNNNEEEINETIDDDNNKQDMIQLRHYQKDFLEEDDICDF